MSKIIIEILSILLSFQYAAPPHAGAAPNVKDRIWTPPSSKIHPLHITLKVSHSDCLARFVANMKQGQGECKQECLSITTANKSTSQAETTIYAPRGLPNRRQKLRGKPLRMLNLESPLAKGAVARIRNTCLVRHRGLSLVHLPCLQHAHLDRYSQPAWLD